MGEQERKVWHDERSTVFARMTELHQGAIKAGKPFGSTDETEEAKNYRSANARIEELDLFIRQDFQVQKHAKELEEQAALDELMKRSLVDPTLVTGGAAMQMADSLAAGMSPSFLGISPEHRSWLGPWVTKKELIEYRTAWCQYVAKNIQPSYAKHEDLPVEVRSMTASEWATGGALTAPKTFTAGLLKAVDRLTEMKQEVTNLPRLEKAESLGKRVLSQRLQKYQKLGELQAPTADQLKFEGREMVPHGFGALVLLSKLLLQRSEFDVESLVRDEMAYSLAITQEDQIVLGSGNGEPLGLMVPHTLGVPTSRDVRTAAAAAVDLDAALKAIHKVPAIYARNGKFYFHGDVILAYRMLKTASEQNYKWQESSRAGEPTTLFNYPVKRVDSMPSTITADLYTGLFGDLKAAYEFVDAWQNEVQRLVEMFSLNNQVGIIHRCWYDGAPNTPDAVARIQQASS